MLGLRRASTLLRNQSYRVGVTSVCCAKLDVLDATQEHGCSSALGKALPLTMLPNISFLGESLLRGRHLSSQAGEKSSSGEADVEDIFSELDGPLEADKTRETNCEEEENSRSEPVNVEGEASGFESDSEDAKELNLVDVEVDDDKAKISAIRSLLKAILDAPSQSVGIVLDKFVEDGHTLGRSDISVTMLNLRRRRLFGKALKLSAWVETKKPFELSERDYASLVDLIAKVQGLYKAEKYIEKIPEECRGEISYRTLLANCVSVGNLKKSEEVFNKMKDLGFPLTAFVCNQLLLLYKKLDRKKIADVLLMMENENVKPTNFTYRILIEVKGRSNDMDGMEQVVESMKAEGLEPDMYIQSTIARYYIFGGCNEKAEAVLKEIEGTNIKENRAACKILLPLYAALDQVDDVGRLWGVCEQNPRLDECVAAIESWGKLGCIENAEAVFERMKKTWKKLSSRYYNALLKVYANHKLLTKGKELVKQMSIDGCKIGPVTWDALVKLYVEAGEVEKADSLLEKAAAQSNKSPMYASFLSVLENFAKRGDIHNSEKIFYKLRTSGYAGRMRMYQLLLEAYIMAKAPAYGFRERMKADNIFPNNVILGQLKTMDAFKKTEISELLD